MSNSDISNIFLLSSFFILFLLTQIANDAFLAATASNFFGKIFVKINEISPDQPGRNPRDLGEIRGFPPTSRWFRLSRWEKSMRRGIRRQFSFSFPEQPQD
jgi:hypothetical protein